MFYGARRVRDSIGKLIFIWFGWKPKGFFIVLFCFILSFLLDLKQWPDKGISAYRRSQDHRGTWMGYLTKNIVSLLENKINRFNFDFAHHFSSEIKNNQPVSYFIVKKCNLQYPTITIPTSSTQKICIFSQTLINQVKILKNSLKFDRILKWLSRNFVF